MVGEELISRKFNAHCVANGFLEFKNADAVQFPREMCNVGGN